MRKPYRHILTPLFVGLACSVAPSGADAIERLRYVVPAEVAASEKVTAGFAPKVRWVPLTTTPPAILVEQPPHLDGTRLYALLRYGSPDSSQVVLIVDDGGDRAGRLYADLDRTGSVQPDELVNPNGDFWHAVIESQITRGDQAPLAFRRQVVIRRGAAGDVLGVATVGYMEGVVQIDGRPVDARRVDGNANGLFADPQDRVWLDLNEDGKWDPFSEQFPFAAILNIRGRRYAVRSDQAGERLAFDEVTASGKLQMEVAHLPAGAAVRELEVALMGEDGSAYAARAEGALLEVPEGRYAVRSLRVVLVDEIWLREWCFVFTRMGDPRSDQWHDVHAGETVALDPVGQLRLEIEGDAVGKPASPGRQITVEPQLYTQDGLVITGCDISGSDTNPLVASAASGSAEVELCLANGTVASSYTSGFS